MRQSLTSVWTHCAAAQPGPSLGWHAHGRLQLITHAGPRLRAACSQAAAAAAPPPLPPPPGTCSAGIATLAASHRVETYRGRLWERKVLRDGSSGNVLLTAHAWGLRRRRWHVADHNGAIMVSCIMHPGRIQCGAACATLASPTPRATQPACAFGTHTACLPACRGPSDGSAPLPHALALQAARQGCAAARRRVPAAAPLLRRWASQQRALGLPRGCLLLFVPSAAAGCCLLCRLTNGPHSHSTSPLLQARCGTSCGRLSRT